MAPTREQLAVGLDHTTASAVDGPRFVAWLEEREDLSRVEGTLRRQLDRWRRGQQASIRSVDRALIHHFGRLLSDLPDDVWIAYDNGRRRGAA